MEKRALKVDDVVQLSPETTRDRMFAGCMLVVTEPKGFGCQGYIQGLGADGNPGGQAYYRPTWDEMEPVGLAFWVAQ
jgi:hypothetical protein